MGINPEKSLKKTLDVHARDACAKPGSGIRLPPPRGLPACGEPFREPAALTVSSR